MTQEERAAEAEAIRQGQRIAAARLAVGPRIADAVARDVLKKSRHLVNGGALRLLMAFAAVADEHGRFFTAYGEGKLFEAHTYYGYISQLITAGLIEKHRRGGRTQRRHLTVTAAGQTLAALTGRRIEAAAHQFLAGASYADTK